LTIKTIDYAGSKLSVQSATRTSGAQRSGGSSATVQTSVLTNLEKYTSNAVQSSLLINESTLDSGKISTSGKVNSLANFSRMTPSGDLMSSVLAAGGMNSLYDQMRLEYASSGRSISQIEIGDVQTVSSDTSDTAASDVTTIYQDVISSNMLMNRGFDPTRSSIIGSFEFIPIADEIETNDQTLLYDFTPTTCLLLVDMQSITQQTRLFTVSTIIYSLGGLADDDSAQSSSSADYSGYSTD